MPNNLVATPIVDKNGKRTTVRKKPEAGAGAAQKVANIKPVLSSASRTNKPAAQRLPPLGEITEEELRQLGEEYPELSHSTRDMNSSVDILLAHTPPSTWALVKRVMDAGLDADLIVYLTGIHEARVTRWWTNGASDAEHAVAQLNNCMLVAERIGRDYPDMQGESGDFLGRQVSRTLETYAQSVTPNRLRTLKLFRTEDQLDGAAAVTAFVINCDQNHSSFTDSFIRNINISIGSRSFNGAVITNSDVDEYIREHPHDLPRIMKYMDDYEYGNSAQDAETLISFLEETTDSPLVDGWL